jgi:hypothetical protein
MATFTLRIGKEGRSPSGVCRATQPQLPPALLRLSALISQNFTGCVPPVAPAVVETENDARRSLETPGPKTTDLIRIGAGIVLARRYPQLALLEVFHAGLHHVTKT